MNDNGKQLHRLSCQGSSAHFQIFTFNSLRSLILLLLVIRVVSFWHHAYTETASWWERQPIRVSYASHLVSLPKIRQK